ncbi:MAG: (d)CMP kinase [Dehalococcoidia bacterium]
MRESSQPPGRPVPMGRRVAVYGPSGSGKSTLSRDLAERFGLPLLELDAMFHAYPNWVDLTHEEFRERVSAFLSEHPDEWVIEGNYSFVRDLILPNAETAIWLRLPWRTVYRRLAWRTVSRSFSHYELWNGNRETLRQTFFTGDSMLIWGIKAFRRQNRSLHASLVEDRPGARVYVLRTPGQVRYLQEHALLAPAETATMPAQPEPGG